MKPAQAVTWQRRLDNDPYSNVTNCKQADLPGDQCDPDAVLCDPRQLKKAREIGGAAEIKNARLYARDLLQTVADHEGTPFVFSGLSAASTNNGQQKAKKRKLTMWYFAWLLGLPLAAIFAVMNAMWLEMKEDEQTIAEGARTLAPNPRV